MNIVIDGDKVVIDGKNYIQEIRKEVILVDVIKYLSETENKVLLRIFKDVIKDRIEDDVCHIDIDDMTGVRVQNSESYMEAKRLFLIHVALNDL